MLVSKASKQMNNSEYLLATVQLLAVGPTVSSKHVLAHTCNDIKVSMPHMSEGEKKERRRKGKTSHGKSG